MEVVTLYLMGLYGEYPYLHPILTSSVSKGDAIAKVHYYYGHHPGPNRYPDMPTDIPNYKRNILGDHLVSGK